MEKAEAALNKFRRAHGVVSVEKGENIVVDRLVDLNKQLTAARAQRIEAESLYRTVDNRNNQDLAQVMTQGLVQQLKSNVANLEAEKVRAGTVFKPDHPRMQELNQHIAAARQALSNEIAHVVRGDADIRQGVDPSLLTAKRNVTLTALQALTTLNNPLVVRQCEHFAERLQRESRSLSKRIERAFQLALCRPPRPDEIDIPDYSRLDQLGPGE